MSRRPRLRSRATWPNSSATCAPSIHAGGRSADTDAAATFNLIPGNVLVVHGRLAGVLDVGGLGPADPALDLVCAWHLLDDVPRGHLREDLGCDDLEWQRGKAWAFEQAMGAAWYYRKTNRAMSHMGQVTLQRLIADELTQEA